MKEIAEGVEKQKEKELKHYEESTEKTDGLITALTQKQELETQVEELKHDLEEMKAEFNDLLEAQVKEHEEKNCEGAAKLIQALTDK